MTELAENLLEILTSGKSYSREALSGILDVNDRDVRRAVAELRKKGYPVCSNSGNKGYRIGDEKDRIRTIEEYRHRAYDLFETAQAMENKMLKRQIQIDDRICMNI